MIAHVITLHVFALFEPKLKIASDFQVKDATIARQLTAINARSRRRAASTIQVASIMGTAPLSKPLAKGNKPIRPFSANRKSCVAHSLLPTSKQTSTLQQLILLQDWQRVLIRAKLFRHELSQPIRMHLYGISIQVLPLHLVCTLQPPPTVVQLFLQLHVDAAGTPVVGTHTKRKKRSRLHQWRRTRRGAFPDDAERLLPDRPIFDEESVISKYYSAPFFPDTNEGDGASISSSFSKPEIASISSKASWHNGAVLQLSPSGGLSPLPLNTSHETQSTKSTEDEVYLVDWDLRPLWELVQTHGELLPLHLACLYQCSAEVVETLVKHYPFAALCEVLGMLPLHIVAAGWILQPIQSRPNLPLPLEFDEPAPFEILQVLTRAVPETRSAKSLNHGMTAQDYVEQCMEDGKHKENCLEVFQQSFDEDDDDYEGQEHSCFSVSTPDSLMFVDSSDSSCVVQSGPSMGLAMLLQNCDWETVLQMIEDDPSNARQWLYGVDEEENNDLHVWKRLPLHLACVYGAPVGLIDVLLKAFPESGSLPDDLECLPLHVACRYQASLPVVQKLLAACPGATTAVEQQGRLPLQYAVKYQAPYMVIEKLVDVDPEAIPAVDTGGMTSIDHAVETFGKDHVVVELLSMVMVFMENTALRSEQEI